MTMPTRKLLWPYNKREKWKKSEPQCGIRNLFSLLLSYAMQASGLTIFCLWESHLIPLNIIIKFTGFLPLFSHFLIPNSVLFFFFLGEQVSLLPTELGFFFNCQCLILQFNNNLNRPTFPPLTHQSSPPPLFHIP